MPRCWCKSYEIVKDAFNKKQVFLDDNFMWPICKFKNIILQKGYGYSIYDDNTIALICNNCRKIYGFNDVKYCPKELYIYYEQENIK